MSEKTVIKQEFTSKDHALEIVSAVMLSLATLASSWSAYQATRWSGVQATEFSRAGSLRVESSKQTTIGGRKVSIQAGLFVQYAAARSQGNDSLAQFLFDRFPPELKTATEAWLKTEPLKNPDAPSSPFVMKEYRIEELENSDQLSDQANASFEKARVANQTGDNYILLTVLFASVLFFSGVAPKFSAFQLRVAMLGLGIVVFLVAAVVLSAFPVH